MKPFDESKEIICKKCGWIHSGRNSEPSIDYQYGVFDEALQSNMMYFGQGSEYFIRTCRRCGYKWAESVPERI